MAISVEKMITDLDALPEATTADKVHMFVQLCDHEVLMNAFKKQAMMQKMEMATHDDVYSFAYGVLKLSCPHLFVEEG